MWQNLRHLRSHNLHHWTACLYASANSWDEGQEAVWVGTPVLWTGLGVEE